MAKVAYQQRRCGGCHFINRDAYRGVGKVVCYKLQSTSERNVAVEVSEDQKACTKYDEARKIGRVG